MADSARLVVFSRFWPAAAVACAAVLGAGTAMAQQSYNAPDPFLGQTPQQYNPAPVNAYDQPNQSNYGYGQQYTSRGDQRYDPADNNAPLPQSGTVYGRVLRVTPAYQQVNTPQTVCNDQQVYTGQRNSGLGAVAGAVIGGVLGNGVGGGFGRAAATGVGVIAGSAIGNQLEGGYPSYQNVRQCNNQYVSQNQQVGYTVEYEYAGQRYTTQTSTPPGEHIALNVQPDQGQYQQQYLQQYQQPDPYANAQPGVVVGSPVLAPYYAAPVYAAPPLRVQPVIQIEVGGYWGSGHRHWR